MDPATIMMLISTLAQVGSSIAGSGSGGGGGASDGGGGGLSGMLGALGQGAGGLGSIFGAQKAGTQPAPIAKPGSASPFHSTPAITAQPTTTGMGGMGNGIMQMIQKLLAGGQG